MTRQNYERIREQAAQFPGDSTEWMNIVIKLKEIEVLGEISESLKSIAASLRGDKL